jgi:hypothetical protein
MRWEKATPFCMVQAAGWDNMASIHIARPPGTESENIYPALMICGLPLKNHVKTAVKAASTLL